MYRTNVLNAETAIVLRWNPTNLLNWVGTFEKKIAT